MLYYEPGNTGYEKTKEDYEKLLLQIINSLFLTQSE